MTRLAYCRLTIIPFTLPLACSDPPPPSPAVTVPVAAPAAPGAPPLGPVAPGQYVNHVGNPAAGQWGPDGQWQWKDPESKEANDTWKFLAAAGAGAAGGAALSYMLSKRHFEQKNPSGSWTREANIHDEHTYRDRYGKPISAAEYERRRAQSERDRAAHRARVQAQQAQNAASPPAANPAPAPQQYRDKQGRFISREEYERRQAQSARDKSRHQAQQKPRNVNRRSRRR